MPRPSAAPTLAAGPPGPTADDPRLRTTLGAQRPLPAAEHPPGAAPTPQAGPPPPGNGVGSAAAQAPSGAAPPDGAGVAGISADDIQLVQNLIERCLQLYMTRDEVVSILKSQATVEPGFTALVWQKLEEQNPQFFRCYYTRLKLKAQIVMFNHLLEQQVAVMQRMQRGWAGGGGTGGSVSTTASGIPLFQGSGGGGAGQHQRAGSAGGGHPPPQQHPGGGAQQAQQAGHPAADSGFGKHPAAAGPQQRATLDHGGGGGAAAGGQQAGVSAGGDSGGDFSFPMAQALDGGGVSPLFATLPHIGGDDHDMATLGHALPTPSELQQALAYLPQPSPLNVQGRGGGGGPGSGGGAATLPRNFSLSDLGMGMGAGGNLEGGEASARQPLGLSPPRNVSLSELDGAGGPPLQNE